MIYQDEEEVQSWKEKRLILNQDIQEFGKQLKDNDLNFDQEVFNQFAAEGSEFVWALLKEQIDNDIKRMKITSKIAKSNLLKGINAKADGFKPIHEQILKGLISCQNKPEDITISSQGKSILTKQELEKKREFLSIYVETEVQLELWKILENTCKFLNDLEKFVSKKPELRSIFAGGFPNNLTDYIFWQEDSKGGMIFKPDYDAIQTLK